METLSHVHIHEHFIVSHLLPSLEISSPIHTLNRFKRLRYFKRKKLVVRVIGFEYTSIKYDLEKVKLSHESGVDSRHLSDHSRHLCLLHVHFHFSTSIKYIYTLYVSSSIVPQEHHKQTLFCFDPFLPIIRFKIN
jgi:hypothetical protein